MFNARGQSEPNGPLQILKNAWREDGRPKEPDLYRLVQDFGGPFGYPTTLGKCVAGRDVRLHGGGAVTIVEIIGTNMKTFLYYAANWTTYMVTDM